MYINSHISNNVNQLITLGNSHSRDKYAFSAGYPGMYLSSMNHLTFTDGRTYIGQTVVSLTGIPVPHGYGTMTSLDGVYYRGNWHQGQRHGTGLQVDPSSGRTYYGAFVNDREEGYAIVTRSGYFGETRHYEGFIYWGNRHGQGIQIETMANGSKTIFEGTWEDDVLEGWGRYTTTSVIGATQTYEGWFVNGQLQGQGYMVDSSRGNQRWPVTFAAGNVINPPVGMGWV